MKKYLLLSLCLFWGLGATFAQNSSVIEPELQEVINQKRGDSMISVNIILKSQIDDEALNARLNGLNVRNEKRQIVVNELKKFTSESQSDVMSVLQAEEKGSKVTDINAHWLVNMVNCTTTRDVIYRLSEHPDVRYIGYNKKEKLIDDAKFTKADARRGVVENVTTVNADAVWTEGYTGKGVLVAVLDTGVNIDHVDLVDHLWDGSYCGYPNHGWNCVEENDDTYDYNSHGTHCAGTICGDGTSGYQTGMAPDATLMCVKIIDDEGNGTLEDFVEGVEFAVYNGAQVLSISVGWRYPTVSVSEVMRELFENVMYSDVIASVAAGNDRDEIETYPIPCNINAPGNCPPPYLSADQQANSGGLSAVVCVGAVDYSDEHAYFSSEGPVTWQNTYWGDYAYQVELNDTIFTDENWMYYDDGTCKTCIGVGADYSFYWGIKFEPEDLQEHGGTALTEIAMYDYAPHTGYFYIYQGGETAPETMINYQSYTGTGSECFVSYTLDYPGPIDPTQPLWIIANNNTGVDYPAAASEFTGNSNGSWCSLDGSSWYDIGDPSMFGESLTWMIRAYVTNEAKGEMTELKQIADFNIEQVASADKLSSSGINNNIRSTNTSFGLIRPDVSAPGVDIISAAYDDNYGHYYMSGTSMATPCVAGVMALMLDKNPDLTPADICRILEETANPLDFNKSNLTGSGRINAYSAIIEIEDGNDDDEIEILIEDDFESYVVGNKIATESNANGNDWWTTWSDNPGSNEDGTIVELNGNKCAYLTYGNDQVLKLGAEQSGVYDLEFDVMVPQEKNGYFNILHKFDGANSKWAMQSYLHITDDGGNTKYYNPGHGTVHAGSNGTADVACVFDQWMHFRLHVDTDADLAQYYYSVKGGEEQLVCEWQWSLDSFGDGIVDRVLDAMNFFPPMDNSAFYLDNFKYTRIGGETSADLVFYPDNIDITMSVNDVKTVEINVKNEGTSIGEYSAWVDYGVGAGGSNEETFSYAIDPVSSPSSLTWNSETPVNFEVASLFPATAYGNSVMGTYITGAAYSFFEWVDANGNPSADLEPGTDVIFRIYGPGTNGKPGEILAEKTITRDQIVWNQYTLVEFDEPVALTGFDVYVAVEMTAAVNGTTMSLDSGQAVVGFGDLYRQGKGAYLSITENAGTNYGNWCLYMVCEGTPVVGNYATLNKTNGSIAVGGNDVIELGLNASNLEQGEYNAVVKVNTNVVGNEFVEIPISLHVTVDENPSNDVMSTTYDSQSNSFVANRMYQKEDGSVAVVATM